jgi:uncharacterized protein (DUF488 family)
MPVRPERYNATVTIWTVGHSTRTAEQFASLLRAYDIRLLIDIRTVPRSRRNPQFNVDELPGILAEAGIAHQHMAALGGLRQPDKHSINTGWQNESFRGYADYMQTPQFERAVLELIRIATPQRTAIMCAEAVPWRCHRSLVADALTARNIGVTHILSETIAKSHTITPFARIDGVIVTYPGFPLPLAD